MWTCEYEFVGTDTDGTDWSRCKVHGHEAPSMDAPCAGWYAPPYADEELTPEQALCADQNEAYEALKEDH